MMTKPLGWRWLGRVPHRDAVARMESLRARILDGDGDEELLLCEHDPVITLGRRAEEKNILASEAQLAARGITLERASRGGDVTYHGPGQLVAYPVVRLEDGVIKHVERLAAATIALGRQHGVEARFDRQCPGVWVGDAKLAALGVHVHRRVAIHGIAVNLRTVLDAYQLIVPCGLRNSRVTSIAALTGSSPSLPEAAEAWAAAFGAAAGRAMRRLDGNPALLSPSPPLE